MVAGHAADTGAGVLAIPEAPRRQANVVEMFEFVKSLDVDPVKDREMLWIAEEAFHAQLPPSWTEHTDGHGRLYFHNQATGESSWRHPMDGFFKDIVATYRRVLVTGGFWAVEDELVETEETIRTELLEWTELFDEHGDRFYHNRRTNESRFDDPRNGMYHNFYARIKVLAKMREKLPLLARALRPEDPLLREAEYQKEQEEMRRRNLSNVVKVQSVVRMLLAKRRVRLMKAKRTVGHGRQPLKDRLHLRVEASGPGGRKEVVLAQLELHRRQRAARKIQARARGMAVRQRFRHIVMHHKYMLSKTLLIQRAAKAWLPRVRRRRERTRRLSVAAVTIQRIFRGFVVRRFSKEMVNARRRFEYILRCVVKIQCLVRMGKGRREGRRRRELCHEGEIKTIQNKLRAYLVQKEVVRQQWETEPMICMFRNTLDERFRGKNPHAWELVMAPLDGRGRVKPLPCECINLFSKAGPGGWEDDAATHVQAHVRRMLVRLRQWKSNSIASSMMREVVDRAGQAVADRQAAVVKLQAMARGWSVRHRDVLGRRYDAWLRASAKKALMVQPYIARFVEMATFLRAREGHERDWAATRLQAAFRGWLDRQNMKNLTEQCYLPLTGWFEYVGMGPDAVKVAVQFLPNPRFDDYRYFSKYGAFHELEDMQKEVTKGFGKRRSRARKSASGGKHKTSSSSRTAGSKRSQASGSLSRTVSSRPASPLVEGPPAASRSPSKEFGGKEQGSRPCSEEKPAPASPPAPAPPAATAFSSSPSAAEEAEEEEKGVAAIELSRESSPRSDHNSEEGDAGRSADAAPETAAHVEPRAVMTSIPPARPGRPKNEAPLPAHMNPSSTWTPRRGHSLREPGSPDPVDRAGMLGAEASPPSPSERPQSKPGSRGKGGGGEREAPHSGAATERRSASTGSRRRKPWNTPTTQGPNEAIRVLARAAAAQEASAPSRAFIAPSGSRFDSMGSTDTIDQAELYAQPAPSSQDTTHAVEEQRRLKVEELMRRQQKHAARRRKKEKREAERHFQTGEHSSVDEQLRRQHVRELRRWLREDKERNEPARLVPSKATLAEVAKPPLRRADSASSRGEQRMVHRHLHHHVHYHEGTSASAPALAPRATRGPGGQIIIDESSTRWKTPAGPVVRPMQGSGVDDWWPSAKVY